MNLGNITKRDYTIQFSPGNAGDVDLGLGVDMDDPLCPILRRRVFIDNNMSQSFLDEAMPRENDLIQTLSTVYRNESIIEEAKLLSTYFSFHYGIISGQMAYEKARSEIDKKIIMYFEVEVKGDGISLPNNDWETEPKAERVKDKNERLRQFLDDNGSHYVRRLYYGQKFIIRASRVYKNKDDADKFSASMKAVGIGWNSGGGISSEHTKILQDSETEVRSIIVAGGIDPIRSVFHEGIDSALELLKSIKDGDVTIKSGPVKCDLVSFWHTLTDYKMCREVLSLSKATSINAPYGVPRGTVIAWYPNSDNLIYDENSGEIVGINPPEGWSVCDGRGETPNLVGYFIRGVQSFKDVNISGGSETHYHHVSGRTSPEVEGRYGIPEGADNGRGTNWTHKHDFDAPTDNISNLPPFCGLIYLIKT